MSCLMIKFFKFLKLRKQKYQKKKSKKKSKYNKSVQQVPKLKKQQGMKFLNFCCKMMVCRKKVHKIVLIILKQGKQVSYHLMHHYRQTHLNRINHCLLRLNLLRMIKINNFKVKVPRSLRFSSLSWSLPRDLRKP